MITHPVSQVWDEITYEFPNFNVAIYSDISLLNELKYFCLIYQYQ